MSYTVKLIGRTEVAEGTMAFHFEKPAGFFFLAGQSIDLSLVNPPETDAEGNTRPFSITSAPHERDLTITTRMRDTAFKRVLKTLPVGTEVTVDGPFGSFNLHNDSSKPAVLLAGGIGITPFVSIVRSAAHNKLPHEIFLFYSNRRPEDSAFLEELQTLESENLHYHFVGTMTAIEKSARVWEGKRGYIDESMLKEQIPDLARPVYYIAGPAGMVAAMRAVLAGAGVDSDNTRTEEFSGY